MKLDFDEKIADDYTSASQRASVLTEHWVDETVFCPNCGRFEIDKYPNNQPVADFYCSNCKEDYELKSKRDSIGTKILDGAYRTKMERLRSSSNPNLFVLNYHLQNLSVLDFFVIPKHFFVPEIIEKRKPLAASARRAGWIGSNILLQKIPQIGKIFLVHQQKVEPKEKVLAERKKTLTPFRAKIIRRFNPFRRVLVMCKGYSEDYENFTELVCGDDKNLDFYV